MILLLLDQHRINFIYLYFNYVFFVLSFSSNVFLLNPAARLHIFIKPVYLSIYLRIVAVSDGSVYSDQNDANTCDVEACAGLVEAGSAVDVGCCCWVVVVVSTPGVVAGCAAVVDV